MRLWRRRRLLSLLLLDEYPVEDVGDDQIGHDHDRKDEPRDEVDARPVVADRHRLVHDDVPIVDDEQLEERHERGAEVVEVVEGVRGVWRAGRVGADAAAEEGDAELRVGVEESPQSAWLGLGFGLGSPQP